MDTKEYLPHSHSGFIYSVEIINWYLLLVVVLYATVAVISIRWILRNDIMNFFQKTVHILLVLILPVFWFYLVRMIYKPVPGYKKRRWFDSGTSGDSGGFDYYSSDDIGSGGDGGGDGD